MITSPANAAVKKIVLLQSKEKLRSREGVFITEGVRMFLEIPEDRLEEVYVAEGFIDGASHEVRERLGITGYEVVTQDVMKKMSDTQSPQGILSVVRAHEYSPEDILKQNKPFVILDGLQDPGNLGTIFRSAEAFGAAGIILSRDCVSIYNPKSVRSTMGTLFRLPFIYVDDLPEMIKRIKSTAVVYAATLREGVDITECDMSVPCGIVIGNEGAGISGAVLSVVDDHIHIPMAGKVESLNAAVAASVFLYEAFRQRS